MTGFLSEAERPAKGEVAGLCIKGVKRCADTTPFARQQVIGPGGGAAIHRLDTDPPGVHRLDQRPRRSPQLRTSADQQQVQRRIGVIQRREIARLKRSEEHTSELQSLMRISYAVFCLKNKKRNNKMLTLT